MSNEYVSSTHIIQLSKVEIDLVTAILNEVLRGYKLTNSELVLLGDKNIGWSFEENIRHLRDTEVEWIEFVFSDVQLLFLKNSIILVMIKLHEYNLYSTHIGYEFIDCVHLMKRIEKIFVGQRGNLGESGN